MIAPEKLDKTMNIFTEKCVETCVKKVNSNDFSYNDLLSKVLKIYLQLLKDGKCLSSDLFLSLPKMISPLTVMYLKKAHELNRTEEASDILATLVSYDLLKMVLKAADFAKVKDNQ